MDAETLARLKLHLVPGLGPKTLAALLERFESAEGILQASPADWETVPQIGPKTVELLQKALAHQDMAAELALVEKHNARLLHIDHPDYPAVLRTIPTAPGFLFACGSFTEADSRSIAIVGSRHCTAYGRRVAKNLAEGLARAGWTIVSGLARGIDSIAHTAALEAGGRTIAVLAGGIGKLYPPEHKELAERIVQQGVLLSEMPMGMAPMPDLFPRRNRIISGLSRATIIVEAALKSGALITARLAGEQGREVLAVPGPVDSEASEGPHQLIRHGATLVRSVEDVLETLQALPAWDETAGELNRQSTISAQVKKENLGAPITIRSEPPPGLSPIQLQLWHAIGSESAQIDDLVLVTQVSVSEVNSALLLMELGGHVRRLPGNRFARK